MIDNVGLYRSWASQESDGIGMRSVPGLTGGSWKVYPGRMNCDACYRLPVVGKAGQLRWDLVV